MATDREISCPSTGKYASVYREIGDDTDEWEKTLEDAAMAVTPDKYSVGATHMKYKNKPTPVLMLVE